MQKSNFSIESNFDNVNWFHSFDLSNGFRINGIKPIEIQMEEAELIFPSKLDGISVLDIGAWDGYFSFEAERRGADRVLSTDHFCWSGPGWGTRDGFDLMRAHLGSKVEAEDIDVLDLSPSKLGEFDLVLFLGVMYHVKDPYACLEAAAAMCSDHLVIETVTALHHEDLPAMRLYRPGELGDDPTNFWAPNLPALEVMLNSFGFNRLKAIPSPVSPKHPLNGKRLGFNRTKSSLNASYRTIVHAWRS